MQSTNAITLNIPNLTAKEFIELCKVNRNLRLELAASGEDVLPGFVLNLQKVW